MKLEKISKGQREEGHPAPLLFVHGAWHAAWCWDEYFLDYFVETGFEVHAISLRGHGGSSGRERLRWTRIREYVEDVSQAATELSPSPVVIGHSMGGLVVQKYLESHPAPAGVLLASVPPAGVLATALRIARRHPLIFARLNLQMSLYQLVSTPDLAREYLFAPGLPKDRLLDYQRRLQEEAYLGFLDMLAFSLPQPKRVKTPLLVLGGENDQVFYPHEVAATARAYGTQPVMYPNMGHDMMLELGWQAVADRIIEWLKARNL